MLVGPHQKATRLLDLAGVRPGAVDIGQIAPGPDDKGGDVEAGLRADRLGRLDPGLAADAGKQGEPTLPYGVERGNLFALAIEPDMGQPRARPCRRLVVKLPVPPPGRL